MGGLRVRVGLYSCAGSVERELPSQSPRSKSIASGWERFLADVPWSGDHLWYSINQAFIGNQSLGPYIS